MASDNTSKTALININSRLKLRTRDLKSLKPLNNYKELVFTGLFASEISEGTLLEERVLLLILSIYFPHASFSLPIPAAFLYFIGINVLDFIDNYKLIVITRWLIEKIIMAALLYYYNFMIQIKVKNHRE